MFWYAMVNLRSETNGRKVKAAARNWILDIGQIIEDFMVAGGPWPEDQAVSVEEWIHQHFPHGACGAEVCFAPLIPVKKGSPGSHARDAPHYVCSVGGSEHLVVIGPSPQS